MTRTRCGVLGSPISHSLSPAMHRAAYRELGLDWEYQAIEIGAGGLEHFLARCDDSWRGFSVTAPLKLEAAAAAQHKSDDVLKLSVANTLIRSAAGWNASNTDVPGATSALHAVGINRVNTVRIYGAGATAISMAYVASKLGATQLELRVRNRGTALETAAFAQSLGLNTEIAAITDEPAASVDLVVTTVPAPAVAGLEHSITATANAVFDVVYDPWPTPVMVSAQHDGTPLVTGIDLLAHQAVLQLTAMTGETVSPDLLTKAALTELGSR
ncbi:MAG: shikimate dehydrogenase [Actinomycetales bacterium]|nr:shikimate dehydrogenase [Actinomycetales bacterium]